MIEKDLIEEYANLPRERLCRGDMSDLTLANRQYMASRTDLDLVVWQTAAKERIRWLSVQLAIAEARSAALSPHHRLSKAVRSFMLRFGNRDVCNSVEWDEMEAALAALSPQPTATEETAP